MTQKVLIIKTSSLGDVIHTLPAVTDAMKANLGIQFDWVVEAGFADIPKMHPAVNRVIPVNMRAWRKNWLKSWFTDDMRAFRTAIRETRYDAIIDAQGLIKSAALSLFAKGERFGLDKHSAREGLSALFYHYDYHIPKGQHAIERVRQLFAKALTYQLSAGLDYGIQVTASSDYGDDYVVFLHGTTWATKHWPEIYWRELAERVSAEGRQILLPYGSDGEKARAERIAEGLNATVLPKMSIAELAAILKGASGVVALDSGLTHLCAALAVPTISLFGPTNPILTRPEGDKQTVLNSTFPCAPCMAKTCSFSGLKPINPPCFEELNPERIAKLLSQV